jgi:hypothetical protein
MVELSKIAGASQLIQILKTPVEEAMRATDVELDASALAGGRSLNIGLIDAYRFSQECLIKAFDGLEPRPSIVAFETVQDCIADGRASLDLIVYYSHSTDSLEKTVVGDVALIRQAFKTAPIIVLSDAERCTRFHSD